MLADLWRRRMSARSSPNASRQAISHPTFMLP
jgi:hypothetical protein